MDIVIMIICSPWSFGQIPTTWTKNVSESTPDQKCSTKEGVQFDRIRGRPESISWRSKDCWFSKETTKTIYKYQDRCSPGETLPCEILEIWRKCCQRETWHEQPKTDILSWNGQQLLPGKVRSQLSYWHDRTKLVSAHTSPLKETVWHQPCETSWHKESTAQQKVNICPGRR